MRKRITLRLLAAVIALAVVVLGTHAAVHWHANAYDEQHCQICQIGHAAVPQPAPRAILHAPAPVARFVPAEKPSFDFEPIFAVSVPRAPPA